MINEAYPLPSAFSRRIRQQLGNDADAYFSALELPYVRGIRLNPRKPFPVSHHVPEWSSPILWAKAAYELDIKSTAGSHPLHEAGAYYLQEPSAMVPAEVLAPQPGWRVLDLCAAPGGKSTQLADMLDGEGLLVCNEPIPSRAQVLSRNLERMGVSNGLVVSADPDVLAGAWPGFFDAILVDAPCSGEGMFRRHPEARAEWNENSPAGCAIRQRRILGSAYRMLAPGGRLVYSTCTFSPEENEQVLLSFLQSHPDMQPAHFSVPVGGGASLSSQDGMLRLYPHLVHGEGHFISLLQKDTGKPGSAAYPPLVDEHIPAQKSKKLLSPTSALPSPSPSQSIINAYVDFQSRIATHPLPSPTAMLGNILLSTPPLPPLNGIRVLRAGLHLGTMKGKVFAPDHALAMALPLPYTLPSVPLSMEEAKAYHHGETVSCAGHLRGYALMTYEGLALGFGKASDGRIKNHYPKGLRRP